jgi:hypothetical protein
MYGVMSQFVARFERPEMVNRGGVKALSILWLCVALAEFRGGEESTPDSIGGRQAYDSLAMKRSKTR